MLPWCNLIRIFISFVVSPKKVVNPHGKEYKLKIHSERCVSFRGGFYGLCGEKSDFQS